MRQPPPGHIAAMVLAAGLYLAIGWGYHGLQSACYDSRHSIDNEPFAFGTTAPVIDTLLWPVFLPFMGGQSCEPLRQRT